MNTLPKRSAVVLVVLTLGAVSYAADVGDLPQMAQDLATSIAVGNQSQAEDQARELVEFVDRVWARQEMDVIKL